MTYIEDVDEIHTVSGFVGQGLIAPRVFSEHLSQEDSYPATEVSESGVIVVEILSFGDVSGYHIRATAATEEAAVAAWHRAADLVRGTDLCGHGEQG